MPFPANINEISSVVKAQLTGTRYECSLLEPLSGGNANFVFRGRLARPLEDGTADVLVKHGEGYVSSSPSWKLTTARCVAEAAALRALSSLPAHLPPGGAFSVRSPTLYYFDAAHNTQVQQYLARGVDLKTYGLSRLGPAPTPDELGPACRELGKAIGGWLRAFHTWGGEEQLREEERKGGGGGEGIWAVAKANDELRTIKDGTYYPLLAADVEGGPCKDALLGDTEEEMEESRQVIGEVVEMAAQEMKDVHAAQVVHADFWTGNALLPDLPLPVLPSSATPPSPIPVFIVDWEVVSLNVPLRDAGQMLAEMYELYLFRGLRGGLWLVEGFVDGYWPAPRGPGFDDEHEQNPAIAWSDDAAFRVAVHVGCHLVVVGPRAPGWGTPEDVARVVRVGRDLIVRGWRRDKEWFLKGDLKCLFRQ